ncbi:Aste57867_14466 [Aphanomyces stellatus]|uniref:Aste57867_14466 protein n=1 Tax=Aphanomyces stellatus TaxID=120398 RepID=A0A485L370_9STRA|nr:hypothetical protein As57867_014412 [Aphanomyces stellatus]VFT91288.1 Aste57867_14466 [Aphanomyces stellatus]
MTSPLATSHALEPDDAPPTYLLPERSTSAERSPQLRPTSVERAVFSRSTQRNRIGRPGRHSEHHHVDIEERLHPITRQELKVQIERIRERRSRSIDPDAVELLSRLLKRTPTPEDLRALASPEDYDLDLWRNWYETMRTCHEAQRAYRDFSNTRTEYPAEAATALEKLPMIASTRWMRLKEVRKNRRAERRSFHAYRVLHHADRRLSRRLEKFRCEPRLVVLPFDHPESILTAEDQGPGQAYYTHDRNDEEVERLNTTTKDGTTSPPRPFHRLGFSASNQYACLFTDDEELETSTSVTDGLLTLKSSTTTTKSLEHKKLRSILVRSDAKSEHVDKMKTGPPKRVRIDGSAYYRNEILDVAVRIPLIDLAQTRPHPTAPPPPALPATVLVRNGCDRTHTTAPKKAP